MSDRNRKGPMKRKYISLDDKIRILDRLRDGEKISSVAKSLHLNEATVRTIKKNEEKIRRNVKSSISPRGVARIRDDDLVKMEKALMIWIKDCADKMMPLDGNIIKDKALRIYRQLKERRDCSAEEQRHTFCASKGWFENFKKRFSLHTIRLHGETAELYLLQ